MTTAPTPPNGLPAAPFDGQHVTVAKSIVRPGKQVAS